MPTIDELLNQPIDEEYVFSTDDVDAYCQIDEEGRIITLNSRATVLGVEHDKAVERVFFVCPRYVGDNVNLDLTGCTVYINYMNAGGEKDRYIVTDLNVAEDDEAKVTFSWLLSRKVTAIRGDVHFVVCAVKTKTGGEIEQEWNTTIVRANVLEGLEPEEYVLGSEDMDVVNQLLDMVAQEIDQKGQQVLESIPDDYTELSESCYRGHKAEAGKINLREYVKKGVYQISGPGIIDRPTDSKYSVNVTLIVIDNALSGNYVLQIYIETEGWWWQRYFATAGGDPSYDIDWTRLDPTELFVNAMQYRGTVTSSGVSKLQDLEGLGYYNSGAIRVDDPPEGSEGGYHIFNLPSTYSGEYKTQIFVDINSWWYRVLKVGSDNISVFRDWDMIYSKNFKKMYFKVQHLDETVSCIGDSTTWGDTGGSGGNDVSWTSFLSESCGFSSVVNLGVRGSKITKTSAREDSFCERIVSVGETDNYIIMGGVNDFLFSSPMGEFGDNTQETFFGAVEYIIKTLLSAHPRSNVYFFTPMKCNHSDYGDSLTENSIGLKQEDYVSAIKKVCNKYSIPVLDLFNVSGMSPYVESVKLLYYGDGLHCSEEGYKRLSEKVISPYLNSH